MSWQYSTAAAPEAYFLNSSSLSSHLMLWLPSIHHGSPAQTGFQIFIFNSPIWQLTQLGYFKSIQKSAWQTEFITFLPYLVTLWNSLSSVWHYHLTKRTSQKSSTSTPAQLTSQMWPITKSHWRFLPNLSQIHPLLISTSTTLVKAFSYLDNYNSGLLYNMLALSNAHSNLCVCMCVCVC